MIRCAIPRTPHRRVSPDSAWPLKRADGTPFHSPAASDAPASGKRPSAVEAGKGRGSRR